MEQKKIKHHASGVYQLLTEPKLKVDKENNNLSQTAKTYIEEIFLKNKYNYKKIVVTPAILKGLLTESESITLVQNVIGGDLRVKNKKTFEDDYFVGTPDIILPNVIEDVKSSWSIETFKSAILEKSYYTQGQVYMHLTGITNYRLIYCLNDTPKELISNEQQRYFYLFQCDESNPMLTEIYKQCELNHNYSHLPEKERVKIFEFCYDKSFIENLIEKIKKAQKYYNELI